MKEQNSSRLFLGGGNLWRYIDPLPTQRLLCPPAPVERLWVFRLDAQRSTGLINGFVVASQLQIARRQVQVRGELLRVRLVVALQVEFKRQNLKPNFHLIGYRLWV
jgi:hypothetical protein